MLFVTEHGAGAEDGQGQHGKVRLARWVMVRSRRALTLM